MKKMNKNEPENILKHQILKFSYFCSGRTPIIFQWQSFPRSRRSKNWEVCSNVSTFQSWLRTSRKIYNLHQEWSFFFCKCEAVAPLPEAVKVREMEKERAEGFESAAQLAHNELHHACPVHAYMNIKTFFRPTMSWEELAADSQTEAQPWSEQCSQLLPSVPAIRRFPSYRRLASAGYFYSDTWSGASPTTRCLFSTDPVINEAGNLESFRTSWYKAVCVQLIKSRAESKIEGTVKGRSKHKGSWCQRFSQ